MDYINLHVRLGTKDMTSVISRVLKARPEDVELGLDTQRVLSASLTPNEMVDAYGAWQAENSDNSVANFLYAKALGTLDSAVELYKRAVRLNPSFYEANLELARLYMARKRWSGAERCLVKCVEQRGADVEPKRLLAICQARRGKGAEAMGTLCAAMEKLQASPGEKAAAAIDVALLLPSPKDADRFLADLKADPKYNTLYREKNAERKLLYGGISDSDFRGLKTKVLRRYYRLYLLSKGRKKDVLIMPTPKEDFPEFWKVYLMRCMRFKAWRKNAEALYKKTANSDALTEHLIVGMWLDKISPEKAEGKLSSIPPGKEALFYFMLGDAYREKKKSAKAYINFRRAKIAPRSVEKSAVLRLLKEKGA
jgi:tetratricopeptide (TPR) repeat protein